MKSTADQEPGMNLRQTFENYIKSRNMRQTPERFAILDKAISLRAHFDVDSLYNEIDSGYHVSRQTVYNTVQLLCECNILRKHYINGGNATYEISGTGHIHLVCTNCGNVKEISDEKYEEFLESMKFRGFQPAFHTTTLYGMCSSCSRKLKKKSRVNTNQAKERKTFK